MSEKRLWTKPVIAGALAVFGLVTTASLAQAEQMGRDPWNFKVLDNPLALNRAIAIEKQEEDGFSTKVFNSTTSFSSTSAENFTEIISNCGNDASCVVDAAVNRDGTGGAQNSSAASGDK